MKKILALTIFLISFTAIAQKYSYKMNYESNDIGYVTFSNGMNISVTQYNEKYNTSKTITEFDSNKRELRKIKEIENDYVKITNSYPNRQNAEFATIESACGGNACGGTFLYVAHINSDRKIRYSKVDEIDSKFELIIDLLSQNSKAIAKNIVIGTNNYGDDILGDRKLISDIGFVDTRFKNQFIKLVNAHPSSYFSDAQLREPLAKAIGLDNFKDLRSYLEVASESELISGRFIVFNGCMAHSCGFNEGTVVIDAISKSTLALWADIDKLNLKSGRTDKLEKDIIQTTLNNSNINEDAVLKYENNLFKIYKKLKK